MSVKTRAPSRRSRRRGARVAEHGHPGPERRLDAGRRVLDHGAVRGLPAHRRRGVQEQVGRRLAVLDLGGAEDPALEAVPQPRVPEREAHLLDRGARGHAVRQRDRVERGHDARHRLQLLLEGGEHPVEVAAAEALGQPAALVRVGDDVLPRAPHERLDRLLRRHRHADLGQQAREHPVGDRLGVDQHPVAVEDDGARSGDADGGAVLVVVPDPVDARDGDVVGVAPAAPHARPCRR